MKTAFYYIAVAIIVLIGWPFMFICKDKWNVFGEQVDAWFGIKSRYTKQKEARS